MTCASLALHESRGELERGILAAVRGEGFGSSAIGVALRQTMVSATALGALPTLGVVLLGGAWVMAAAGRGHAARRLLFEAGAGVLLAAILKLLVDRARPEVVAQWADVGSRSFPSGDSADSAIVYLLLAGAASEYLGRSPLRLFVQRIAIFVVVLVGLSRVYLGVHWPSDVLAGWAMGGAWAYLCGLRPRCSVLGPVAGAATFHKVTVYPTQDMLRPPFILFRGGPDWPSFWVQRRARHCRFTPAVPFDVRPWRSNAAYGPTEPTGIWCGPICQHFGHAIATFGTRLSVAALLPGDEPMVFSARPGEAPPPFFWQMLDHFGIAAARVRIISMPTLFGRLSVVPQSERTLGGGPGKRHLALLDELTGPAPPPDGSRLYVSRAAMWKGKVAGELYLERVLSELGYATFRPEDFPLDEQLAAYRRASHLVFAEGSALHALQLLGRISADVTVIVRRNGDRMGRDAIGPRVASMRFIDAARGIVHGIDRKGRAQPSAGMTIIDDASLIAAFDRNGIHLGHRWDRSAFLEQQNRDLRLWVNARIAHPLHPNEKSAVRRSLIVLGLDPANSGMSYEGSDLIVTPMSPESLRTDPDERLQKPDGRQRSAR